MYFCRVSEHLVYSFEMESWEERWETGILLQENEQWVLLANIPSDYIIDGYKLIVKKHIAYKYREDNEKAHEKYFKLKNIPVPPIPDGFAFHNDIIETLLWIEKKYLFFEFKDYDEYENFTGRFRSIISEEEGSFTIDYLFNDGTIDTEYETEFFAEDVSIICFDTHYLHAITFLYQENLKGKPAEIIQTKRKKMNRK
jgi:hypothetical protein